jgi:hypothetical protein
MPVLLRLLVTNPTPQLLILLLVDCFHKLSNDQGHTLDSLDLFLCSH